MDNTSTDHLKRLTRSVPDWNQWRKRNPELPIDLMGADLSDHDLVEVNLRSADLGRASLVGALLLGADLSQAKLSHADLRGADLRAAQLTGTDLSTSLFLTQPQIESASGSATTVLPPHLVRPRHWLNP